MKIRAKANGNILDLSEDEARPLVECGVYEVVDEPEAVADEPKKGGRAYKRRDVVAED